jgi:hypothetical protein
MTLPATFGRWLRLAVRLQRSRFNDGLSWAGRIGGARSAPAAGAPRILVATSAGGHLTALNFEALIAKALQVRGASVSALLCDAALPACMETEYRYFPEGRHQRRLARNGPGLMCDGCTPPGRRVYRDLGIPLLQYGDFLSPEDRAGARTLATTIPSGEIRDYRIDRLAVGEHAYAGALRFYARGALDREPEGERLLRRYFEAALLTTRMMRTLLARERFDACLFNHGIYVPQGLIGEVCRESGVRVINWNPAYRKNCFICSHGDTYHHTLMDEPVASWEGLAWGEREEKRIVDYLKSRWSGSDDWIWFHDQPQFDVSAITRRLGLDLSKTTIGLLTNVVWDAQLHYPANAFPGMLEWIFFTVRKFAERPDLQLVIRVHPAEITGTLPSRQRVVDELKREFPQLPPNVFVIPPQDNASTYAVMSHCDSVLIYGTKTGVELSSMGIPVIVAGEAWIRNKGLTRDVTSEAHYAELLAQLPLRARMPAEQVTRARKYAYHFFFRRMIPLPFMKGRKGWPTYAPALAGMDELRPGRYGGLDVICDGILNGAPFIYPAERERA